MIEPGDLMPDLTESAARRLIAAARSIAPCLDTLVDDAKRDAVAILLAVAAEVPTPGSRRIKSQSRNGTSVTWSDYSSAFSPDDRAALRALCGAARSSAGAPAGSFPVSTITRRLWPAEESS